MIIHHKDINKIQLGLKNPLKYSKDYKFVPLKFYNNDKYIDCIFQTPLLFIPFGIKTLKNNKKIIDLSYLNKGNDQLTQKFIDNLTKIYDIISNKYKNYEVNSFLNESEFDLSMRLKINNSLFFDSNKKIIQNINPHSYGEFIIQLQGLWINNNNIWFQWYLLQGKIKTNVILTEYSFKEYDDKYNKMIKMGVPKEAVELKKKIENNIPPPPPPLPSFKKETGFISKIKASDLRNVKLKKINKSNHNQKKYKNKSNHFEPPSLEELQITISKLKKSKI